MFYYVWPAWIYIHIHPNFHQLLQISTFHDFWCETRKFNARIFIFYWYFNQKWPFGKEKSKKLIQLMDSAVKSEVGWRKLLRLLRGNAVLRATSPVSWPCKSLLELRLMAANAYPLYSNVMKLVDTLLTGNLKFLQKIDRFLWDFMEESYRKVRRYS